MVATAGESENAAKTSGLSLRSILIVFPALGLAAGLVAWWRGYADWPDWIFAASAMPVLAALAVEIISSLRKGQIGLDIVAALSMTAALLIGEELAAAIVALMYAGGQYLESFAERRARREMSALLAAAPRTAMAYRDGGLAEIGIDAIAPGDRLLVRQGDVVPVDGEVAGGLAVLDQSALTGEAWPIRRSPRQEVMSGSTNVGEAFDLMATNSAVQSTYAGIVRLVEAAQRSKAPISRLADRFAILFLGITVALALAAWLLSGDVVRAVAVLVVATPCPLILAVPVAIVSGMSRAARHGILVKGGKALEQLARVKAVVVDKTGTLTSGKASVTEINPFVGHQADEILRLAASLDQASQHAMARALVSEANARGLRLSNPSQVVESPGEGLSGEVAGRNVIVGGRKFVARCLSRAPDPNRKRAAGVATVAVAVDGEPGGEIVMADRLRSGTEELLRYLRRLGLERIVLATGDREDVARATAESLDIDAVRADLTPDQKVLIVLAERKRGPVMMVGDGVNDAPALAAAEIGVAMGARGTAASAEAADVVILVDHIDPIVPAIEIARSSRRIALQSVFAGIGLSALGMIAAAFGYLTPVQGALLQEVIDVAVILNALRALGRRFGSLDTLSAASR
jgi:heavy metal translocating P-type ATPase